MIKAVIFDIGGVLVNDVMPPIYDDIQQTLQLDSHAFKKAWDTLTPTLSEGKITEDDYWQQFGEMTNSSHLLPEESMLQRKFKAIRNEPLFDLVKKLKQHGYKLAVLSNTIESHVSILEKQGIYEDFPIKVLSNEVGYIKPTKEIFLLASMKLDTKPEQTVFLDDNIELVEAAKKLGYHGIPFTNVESLEQELIKLGVTI